MADHNYPSTHSSYQAQAAAVMQAQAHAAGMAGREHVGGAMNSSYEQPEVKLQFFQVFLIFLYEWVLGGGGGDSLLIYIF